MQLLAVLLALIYAGPMIDWDVRGPRDGGFNQYDDWNP